MKNLLFTLSILFSSLLNAQISQGGYPYSFTNPQRISQTINEVQIAPPNIEQLQMEDIEVQSIGGQYRVGTLLPVKISPTTSGTWDILENEDRIWRVQITTPEAKALSLYFDDFFLPNGAKMFVYSSDKSELIGSFTEFNNHESKLFATQSLLTNSLIIELYLPASVKNNYALNISDIGYLYRGFFVESDAERSCMVNVNCPEGSNFQDEKKGVAKILMLIGSQQYLCTGSLVNTTNNDCQPYLLTAAHCGEGATTSNFNQWVFYFNYEASSCNGGESGSQNQTITGCQLISESVEQWPPDGSDFLLLKLNKDVPDSYKPYYNGWSRMTNASSSGVGIHHPGGRNKKISTYTSSLISYYTTHWLVYWAETQTNHSVSAGGSSGSPLFNSNGLIVGTLTGGGSTCSEPNEPDIYGKFSHHWDKNGNTNNRMLKPWLDPNGKNLNTLNGIHYNQCGSTPVLSCDTVSNITTQDLYVYYWADDYGYVSGHNKYGIMEFAEKYTNLSLKVLNGIWILPAKLEAGSSNSKITIKIMQGGTKPGSILSSKDVKINSLSTSKWNYIPLNSPITTSGNFFVGYQIYDDAGDSFALAMADRHNITANTVYLKHNNEWQSLEDLTNSNLKSHLAITVHVCSIASDIYEESSNNAQIGDFIIYPNPAQDILNIQFADNKTLVSSITIYDLLGKVIYTSNINNISDVYSISTNHLQNGLYFISIQANNTVHTKRVLIKK